MPPACVVRRYGVESERFLGDLHTGVCSAGSVLVFLVDLGLIRGSGHSTLNSSPSNPLTTRVILFVHVQ